MKKRASGNKFLKSLLLLCMISICNSYEKAIARQDVDPLLLMPVFIADFLCIHPFSDGNGRMSRLLTLLLLYQAGYVVGRYVSIEKHIEKTKEVYYQALDEISQGWHEASDDPEPFIKYMLGVILGCYREFEDRVELGLQLLLGNARGHEVEQRHRRGVLDGGQHGLLDLRVGSHVVFPDHLSAGTHRLSGRGHDVLP